MRINSAVFGPVDVMEQSLIRMPQGLPGFENSKTFALIEHNDQGILFRWLQSTDDIAPCFVVFDPEEIVSGYAPEVDPADLKFLGCKDVAELQFFVLAVIPEDFSKSTVNLKSPIAINKQTNTAMQVILANADYPIRFPLASDEAVG